MIDKTKIKVGDVIKWTEWDGVTSLLLVIERNNTVGMHKGITYWDCLFIYSYGGDRYTKDIGRMCFFGFTNSEEFEILE